MSEKKTTKNIEKERIIVIMKAIINEKTNNPNLTRVFNLTGMYPEMENNLDAWAQELREAGCCLSGFTLKVKALGILRELGQFDGRFYASDFMLRKK